MIPLSHVIEPNLYDNDLYAFTMGQLINEYYPDYIVKYELTVRGNQQPDIDVNNLSNVLNRISTTDIHGCSNSLKNLGFSQKYLDFLKNIELPEVKCYFDSGNKLNVECTGPWGTAIFLETIVMSTISEMNSYNRFFKMSKHDQYRVTYSLFDSFQYLNEILNQHQVDIPLKIVDFGTRRRFSTRWHEYILETITSKYPHIFVGTSNVKLGSAFNIPIAGTMAHQLFMVICAVAKMQNVDRYMVMSDLVDRWEQFYPYDLRIMLPDTYFTNSFLDNVFSEGTFSNWKGLRQDSGIPENFVSNVVSRYPREMLKDKYIMFSDGLHLDAITNLNYKYTDMFNPIFGWGTQFTNNCELIPYINMVFKPSSVTVDGNTAPIVKLSDTPGKYSGDKDEIAEYIDYFK